MPPPCIREHIGMSWCDTQWSPESPMAFPVLILAPRPRRHAHGALPILMVLGITVANVGLQTIQIEQSHGPGSMRDSPFTTAPIPAPIGPAMGLAHLSIEISRCHFFPGGRAPNFVHGNAGRVVWNAWIFTPFSIHFPAAPRGHHLKLTACRTLRAETPWIIEPPTSWICRFQMLQFEKCTRSELDML